MNGKQSKSFRVTVDLRQGCVSSLYFIIYMEWIDKSSQTNEFTTNGNGLLFADDRFCFLPLNLVSNVHLIDFAATYDNDGMKFGTTKAKVLHLSKNAYQCSLQLSERSINITGEAVQVSWVVQYFRAI